MGRCRKDFEKWHGFEVCEDMDIQTSVAWENWQKAWNAARETLTEKARENEYGKRATIWLTEGTPDREKYAFSDGHYRGWHDAVAYLTHNDRVEGRDAASSRRVPSHDGLCGNGNYNERTEK